MIEPILDPALDLTEHVKTLPPQLHGKLGAHVGGGDPRFPMLRDHVDRKVQVPAACHRSLRSLDYGMLGNDTAGDCVIARIFHSLQHSRAVVGRTDVPPGNDALTVCAIEVYSRWTGFDPSQTASDGSNPTDQGTDPAMANARWQSEGVPLPDGSTDKIVGTAQVLPHDGVNVRRAIWEFSDPGLALAMPLAWQSMDVWDAGGDPQSDPNWQPGGWGGHMVTLCSYDAQRLAVITWGGIKLITWRALGTYGTLILASVSRDQISAGGTSVTGVNYDTLAQELPQL